MNDREKKRKLYRRKKRKQRILAGCMTLTLLAACGTALYATRDSLEKPNAANAVVAEAPESEEKNTEHSTETETITEAPTEAPVPDVEITVSVMGDCTLGTDENFYYATSLNAYYDSQGADYFFQNIRPILEKDDLSIVNMEGTLTESTAHCGNKFAFKGAPEYVNILSGSSVEAANLANNHSHDYGDQSFADTKQILTDAGITAFGYDDTAVMEIKGVKVGLVGIYELYDHLERMQQLQDNIARVKEEGAKLVIVIFHWGNERETVPDSNQVTLGHAAIDCGADLVIGHHPHVLQGIEEYRGKMIAYSLGNFCFGGNSAPSDMDTMIYQQTFTIRDGQVVADQNTTIIPCSISSAASQGYNNYQPTPAEGSEAERILQKIEERSSQISGSYL